MDVASQGIGPGAFPLPFGVIQVTPGQRTFLEGLTATDLGNPVIAGEVPSYVGLLGHSSGMAVNGAWPAALGGQPGFPTSCAAPPCFVPASYVSLSSLIGNFPVSERTDLYSLRLDHNISNNNRLTLKGQASPSDLTGIQVQAQGPQNFGQNSYSRTSNQNYHDWGIAGLDT